jgi:FkbM family methyltransferase
MPFLSYAQNMEDVMLHRALREVKHGFYVDVGANSPDLQSVTKAFYQDGWRGINIEPMAVFHEQLMTARPHDINLGIAVGDRSGMVKFYDMPGSELSTADPETANRHRQAGREIVERQVPVETLDAIFRAHAVDQIHFLKIDVEGWEAHVLRGLSLKTIRPWIIVVEATVAQTQIHNHQEWDPLLTGRGYRFVYFDGLNRFYVAEEKAELVTRFDSPPNIFDDWIRAHDWAAHELVGNLSRRIDGERDWWNAERDVRRREAEAYEAEIQLRQDEARARLAEADVRRSEVEARRVETDFRQTEIDIRRAEADIRRAEADIRRAEADIRQAEIVAHSTDWMRLTDESAALRHRIAELESITSSLETYIHNVRISFSWRITAPVRALKRMLVAFGRTLQPQRGVTRSVLVKMARKTARWAAENPSIRKAVLPVLLYHPTLEGKARALLARERPTSDTAPVPPVPSGDTARCLATMDAHDTPAPLVARSLSPAERTIEAAIRRAQARAR